MTETKLIDRFNRNLNYLRLSITDRCNMGCIYCVPKDLVPKLSHQDILTYEEILRLVRICVNLGINKVRVTGGEPLVRKGVYQFLKELNRVGGIKDVALTTNGVLLYDNIQKIKSAGIKRLNISLDTLKKEKFREITGVDRLGEVWKGIMKAWEMGFSPIKINVVALSHVNEDEFIDFADLSFSYPFHIRFIEHMPIGESRMKNTDPLLITDIKKKISTMGKLVSVDKESSDGPAERYKFEGAKGEIGFIGAISQHFCESCNRLRLTASGQLRPCLLSDINEDLKIKIRAGCSDEEITETILKAVAQKPSTHSLLEDEKISVSSQMSSIGG